MLQEVAWNTDTYLFKARDWITSDTFRLTDKTKDAQFITESAGKLYELGFNKKTNKKKTKNFSFEFILLG